MALEKGTRDGRHGESLYRADSGRAQDLGSRRVRETRPVMVEAGFDGPEAAATACVLEVEGTIVGSGAHSVRKWRRPWPRYMELTGRT